MTHLTGWKATASALAVAVALQAVLVSAGIAPVGIILVVGLLFRTAVVAPARVTWPLALGSMAVLGTVEVLAARAQGQDHDLFVVVLLLALAAAAGLSLRYHRAFVGEAVARAEAAERGAEAEARRRVADDRLRIARDLHDSVAHRMAVVNMQASAAQKLLTRDPQAASAMLDQVREAVRAAISETATLVGGLREEAAPLTPGPVVDAGDALGDLTAPVIAADGRVRADVAAFADLPTHVQELCRRVLTEAFTNAARHAPGSTVDVTIEREADDAVVRVVNGPAHRPVEARTSGGHGLVGMRERVREAGGVLSAGARADGGFELSVRVPVAVGVRP